MSTQSEVRTYGQKYPLSNSLNSIADFAVQRALQLMGESIPAEVTAIDSDNKTVTVKLNGRGNLVPVIIPIGYSEYVRLPIKVGDSGLAMKVPYFLEEVARLSLASNLSMPPNLSGMFFLPISNADWDNLDEGVLGLFGDTDVQITNETLITTLIAMNTYCQSFKEWAGKMNAWANDTKTWMGGIDSWAIAVNTAIGTAGTPGVGSVPVVPPSAPAISPSPTPPDFSDSDLFVQDQ